jgi:hypothetical protein
MIKEKHTSEEVEQSYSKIKSVLKNGFSEDEHKKRFMILLKDEIVIEETRALSRVVPTSCIGVKLKDGLTPEAVRILNQFICSGKPNAKLKYPCIAFWDPNEIFDIDLDVDLALIYDEKTDHCHQYLLMDMHLIKHLNPQVFHVPF